MLARTLEGSRMHKAVTMSFDISKVASEPKSILDGPAGGGGGGGGAKVLYN